MRREVPGATLQVDGGVGAGNCGALVAAGADVLVLGTALFSAADYAAAVRAVRGDRV